MLYTIYHIPGLKYGCTNNYPERPASQSGVYEFIEEHTDIMVASEREKQLNLEAGYPWSDSQYYYLMVDMGRIGAISQVNNGGTNLMNWSSEQRSQFAKESTPWRNSDFQSRMAARQKGIPKPTSKALAKALNVEWTCEYCAKIGRGKGNYKRYGHHNGTCK